MPKENKTCVKQTRKKKTSTSPHSAFPYPPTGRFHLPPRQIRRKRWRHVVTELHELRAWHSRGCMRPPQFMRCSRATFPLLSLRRWSQKRHDVSRWWWRLWWYLIVCWSCRENRVETCFLCAGQYYAANGVEEIDSYFEVIMRVWRAFWIRVRLCRIFHCARPYWFSCSE